MPVIDHWWQTETGWSICANCSGIEQLPVKHGSPTKPVPGMDVSVLDSQNREVKRGEVGALVIKLPLPPGTFPTLWNADERFVESYLSEYPGYYKTADAGYIDEDGYVYVMSRTDDIINVAGHRLSTGGMEEVLAAHPDVAECAVVGVNDEIKGQIPLGFLVLKAGVHRDQSEITQEAVHLVRTRRSVPSPLSRLRPLSSGFPKPVPEKSCAEQYRRSPIASNTPCPPPLRTRLF